MNRKEKIMTTKTDASALMDLKGKYVPAARGVLSKSEADLIRTTLEIATRTDIELQNVRDMTVMFYGRLAERDGTDPAKAMAVMDAMSGICAVIDEEKCRRGMPV